MDKTSKVISIILAVVAVILFGVYIFLNNVNKTIPKELVYPESGLSQSIFDSQNTKYRQIDNYTRTDTFTMCPYSYDIADADMARVSDYGRIYKVSDSMYFYTTEYKKEENIDTIMRNELSQAVMVDSNKEMTAVDNIIHDEGYLNGFKADYLIDSMTVTNGTRTVCVYITGYILTITDKEDDHGYRMFVGVMSGGNDTDTYAAGKEIVDSVIGTYRFSDEVQNNLVAQEQAAAAAEEEKRQQAQENGTTYIPPVTAQDNTSDGSIVVPTDGSTTDLAASAGAGEGTANASGSSAAGSLTNDTINPDAYLNSNNNAPQGQGGAANAQIPQQKTKSMTLDKEYSGVTLYYKYENVANAVSVTLANPTGSQTYQPVSSDNGTFIFKLEKMEAGKWQVLINGDAGSDSISLYSDDMSSGSSDDAADNQENGADAEQ